jgi:IS5 family transposase
MKTNPTKTTYRIRNWPEYNAALRNRGSLEVWIDLEAIEGWYEAERSGNPGASKLYSDQAIEMMLVLRAIYRLPFRQTCGLMESIFAQLGLDLKVPDHTRLCRRQGDIDIVVQQQALATATHAVLDSTGLKLYGQGEWHVRQHGASKRRTWRKLHLSVDEATLQLLSAVITDNDVADCEVAEELLDQIEGPLRKVGADGAYDTWDVYEAVHARGASAVIPPRKTARIKQHGNCADPPLERDEHLREIRKKGRAEWKRQTGYHRRSLAETTIYRYKRIFGDKIAARSRRNETTEILLNCRLLNQMAALGMPESFAVG